MRRTLFYLSVALLAFGIGSVNCFGQKQIIKEDYFQILREANKKRFETSRREVSQMRDYKDGKLFFTVDFTSEVLIPDKYHSISIEKYADRTIKNESIVINKIRYCRKNDGEWEKTNKYCGYGSGSGGASNIVSDKYTVEKTKLNKKEVKLYQLYTVYKNIHSPNKDKEGLSYSQRKIWIDKDGFLLREEMESGLSEPNKISFQNVTDYEYNPKNLLIEVPIKEEDL